MIIALASDATGHPSGKVIPNKIYFPGIIAARAWSGRLEIEKDRSMRDLDFTRIHPTNYFQASGNKSLSRAVWSI
ncbi:MAG TPA: hypothetical protein VNX46_01740 [Candidatus Acidoferrum sp.]|nr:hypothetical protein [Candidatus Acidoferrum sp.]